MTEEVRTAFLGRFDEFEAEIVVEILTEAGIFAQTKHSFEEAEHSQYPGMMDERGIVVVDADKLDEAKAMIAERLPEHLHSIEEAMAKLGTEEVEIRFDDAREVWETEPEDD